MQLKDKIQSLTSRKAGDKEEGGEQQEGGDEDDHSTTPGPGEGSDRQKEGPGVFTQNPLLRSLSSSWRGRLGPREHEGSEAEAAAVERNLQGKRELSRRWAGSSGRMPNDSQTCSLHRWTRQHCSVGHRKEPA